MNSNETLGRGRDNMSAMRIGRNNTNPNLLEDEQGGLPGRRPGRLCRPPDEKEPSRFLLMFLPQDPRVSDAARHTLGVEMLEQC
jgi:hypothetical protein